MEQNKTAKKEQVKLGKWWVMMDEITITQLDRYLFLDDDKKVKVYIEMDEAAEMKHRVSYTIEGTKFDLILRIDEGSFHRLKVTDLRHEIDPMKSKVIVKPNKIVLSLHKLQPKIKWPQ